MVVYVVELGELRVSRRLEVDDCKLKVGTG